MPKKDRPKFIKNCVKCGDAFEYYTEKQPPQNCPACRKKSFQAVTNQMFDYSRAQSKKRSLAFKRT